MIEIEQNFVLNPDQEDKLLNGAILENEKIHEDTYYDHDDLRLTLDGNWLRARNGSWEMKLRRHELGHKRGVLSHEELDDENSICQWLGLKPEGSLKETIEKAGYKPFAKVRKSRRSYRRGEFRIDIDKCDFGYEIAEIELLIADDADQDVAIKKIQDLAKSINLDMSPVRGKLIEYLHRYRPDHYKKLLDAGVI